MDHKGGHRHLQDLEDGVEVEIQPDLEVALMEFKGAPMEVEVASMEAPKMVRASMVSVFSKAGAMVRHPIVLVLVRASANPVPHLRIKVSASVASWGLMAWLEPQKEHRLTSPIYLEEGLASSTWDQASAWGLVPVSVETGMIIKPEAPPLGQSCPIPPKKLLHTPSRSCELLTGLRAAATPDFIPAPHAELSRRRGSSWARPISSLPHNKSDWLRGACRCSSRTDKRRSQRAPSAPELGGISSCPGPARTNSQLHCFKGGRAGDLCVSTTRECLKTACSPSIELVWWKEAGTRPTGFAGSVSPLTPGESKRYLLEGEVANHSQQKNKQEQGLCMSCQGSSWRKAVRWARHGQSKWRVSGRRERKRLGGSVGWSWQHCTGLSGAGALLDDIWALSLHREGEEKQEEDIFRV
ncbi:uncharacterized protein LOC115100739 [Rhinatrema bivittatum]|uniref:uncharacterized protein LOC115100739 n=1 Tax=Rhinatrema bivittatum TaxID=194408 RepID=UPI0011284580|nr:uncharacterized protein LOC115100739 [Rhinatrema bivittatum]